MLAHFQRTWCERCWEHLIHSNQCRDRTDIGNDSSNADVYIRRDELYRHGKDLYDLCKPDRGGNDSCKPVCLQHGNRYCNLRHDQYRSRHDDLCVDKQQHRHRTWCERCGEYLIDNALCRNGTDIGSKSNETPTESNGGAGRGGMGKTFMIDVDPRGW